MPILYCKTLPTFVIIFLTAGCSGSRSSPPNPMYSGWGSVVDTGFVKITQIRKSPRAARSCEAIYPDSLMARNIKALVFVKVLVATNGEVQAAEVIKSEDKRFDQSAIDAASCWTFSRHRYTSEVWKILRFDFGPHYWVE